MALTPEQQRLLRTAADLLDDDGNYAVANRLRLLAGQQDGGEGGGREALREVREGLATEGGHAENRVLRAINRIDEALE